MSQLQLRDYQQECLNEHFRYFEHNTGNPLFVVPTGGGKSLIISEFLKVIFNTWKNQKVLILTHVKELIQQNYDEFCRHWGLLAPVGIYSAGLNRRDLHESAIFGGIQSVFNKAEEFGKVDLILIDEAHLCPKKGQGRYRSFIEDCRQINPSLKVLGYTATPYRLDGGYLHEGDGRIFTDIAYEVFLETLIEQKHLVPLVAKRTVNAIDTSKVGTQTGDFKHNELEQAAMASGCVEAAVKELVDRAQEEKRKHWLVFGCGHDHAHDILNHLARNGVYAQIILSTTPKDERRQIIKDAKEGKTTAIVNVGVLTTGFDWPRCDLLAVMRPTQSVSLYVQMMGRGMRTFPGKYNCLVLDYGTNVMRHGPINRVRVKGANKADSESDDGPRARQCPECDMILEPEIKRCPGCGYDFPTRNADHEKIAGTEDPIDFSVRDFIPATPVAHEVLRVYFDRHTKTDKPDSMRVSYQCGLREFREWICFEHGGYARAKASKWWLEHGSFPVPSTVSEALERRGDLRLPKSITVREEGKFDRIINRHFPIGEEPILMPTKSRVEDETEIPF